jgi:hypothetical protein
MKFIGLLCIFLVSVSAVPSPKSEDNDLMDSIYADCLKKDSVSCVKYKLVSFVDKMVAARDVIPLSEGVTVVKVPGAEQEGAPRAITGDESVESLILNRVSRFLQTHTVKVELKGTDIVQAVSSTGRALEDVTENFFGDDSDNKDESRSKKKKAAKLLGPLVMMMALKAAALLPLVLGAIALIAGKALLIGKIALVLSAIIGLKKLLSQEKHVTYEVVAHPHHTSSHSTSHADTAGWSGDSGSYSAGASGASSGGHGWGRSYENNAQNLAYKAYNN